jgi:hypothetical protein
MDVNHFSISSEGHNILLYYNDDLIHRLEGNHLRSHAGDGYRLQAGGGTSTDPVYSASNDDNTGFTMAADNIYGIAGGVTMFTVHNGAADSTTFHTLINVKEYIRTDSVVCLSTVYSDFVFNKDYSRPSIESQYKYAMRKGHLQYLESEVNRKTHITTGDIQRRQEGVVRHVEEILIEVHELRNIVENQEKQIVKLDNKIKRLKRKK